MSQIKKKFIANNQVDETKILLNNEGALRARNAADSADVEILMVNADDAVELLQNPILPSDATNAMQAVTKQQLDFEVSALDGDISSINSTLATHTTQIADLQAEDLVLDGRLDVAEGEIDTLQSEMLTAQSDITALEGDVASLDGRMTTAEGEIDALQIEVASLDSRLDTAEGEIDTLQSEVDTLQTEMLAAQSDILDLENNVIYKDGSVAMTGNLDLGSNKIVNLAAPTVGGDAVNKTYADAIQSNVDSVAQDLADFELDVAATYIPLSQKGANNGVATLDAGGKIPVSQLPNSVMEYQGTWNASTNTPTLADGVGNAGDVYLVSVAGTQNLGSGPIIFAVGDWVVYNGSIWEKSINSNAVVSVNGQTGVVSLDTDDVGEGSTNLYFTDQRATDAVGAALLDTATIDLSYSGGQFSADVIDSSITTAKIAANAVTGAKIRLNNDEVLRARNAANTADISILKVNASNLTEIQTQMVPNLSGTMDLGSSSLNFARVFSRQFLATGAPGFWKTGDATTGNSQNASFGSGSPTTAGANSGTSLFFTGNATGSGNSGTVTVASGNAVDGVSGDVNIQSGSISGTGTRGNINIAARQVYLNNNASGEIFAGGLKIQSVATPTVSTDAANKGYVDSVVTSGLTGVIYADGSEDFTADQSMGGNKLTNLANPVASGDAVNKGYLESYTLNLRRPQLDAFTLSGGDITNKYVVMSEIPVDMIADLKVSGAPAQLQNLDYEILLVSGEYRLSWNGKDLDGILEAGDKITISYLANL
jgi:hypothetical protein